MEALKVVLVTVSISFVIAVAGTLAVTLGLDNLESMRQRWVARAKNGVKIAHAG